MAITADGEVDSRWGWADCVAVAGVIGGQIRGWQEFAVSWGALHDQGTEGAHHARIARFLRDNQVQGFAAQHVGPGIERMLGSMGIPGRHWRERRCPHGGPGRVVSADLISALALGRYRRLARQRPAAPGLSAGIHRSALQYCLLLHLVGAGRRHCRFGEHSAGLCTSLGCCRVLGWC